MKIVFKLDPALMASRSSLSSLWRPIAASICGVSLCVQTGCAVVPSRQLPLPPSDEVRARFGTIGIVSARFTPRPLLQLPAKGGLAGAGRGAANWSAAGGLAPLSGGGGGGNGLGGLILLAASVAGATLGGISGTVAGAVMAEPAEKVRVTETALHDALTVLKLQELLRDRMMKAVQEQTGEHAVILTCRHVVEPAYRSKRSKSLKVHNDGRTAQAVLHVLARLPRRPQVMAAEQAAETLRDLAADAERARVERRAVAAAALVAVELELVARVVAVIRVVTRERDRSRLRAHRQHGAAPEGPRAQQGHRRAHPGRPLGRDQGHRGCSRVPVLARRGLRPGPRAGR